MRPLPSAWVPGSRSPRWGRCRRSGRCPVGGQKDPARSAHPRDAGSDSRRRASRHLRVDTGLEGIGTGDGQVRAAKRRCAGLVEVGSPECTSAFQPHGQLARRRPVKESMSHTSCEMTLGGSHGSTPERNGLRSSRAMHPRPGQKSTVRRGAWFELIRSVYSRSKCRPKSTPGNPRSFPGAVRLGVIVIVPTGTCSTVRQPLLRCNDRSVASTRQPNAQRVRSRCERLRQGQRIPIAHGPFCRPRAARIPRRRPG